MDWNDLRYVLAVHRLGSLARAAAELGVTKATASRRIAALEEALGAAVVDRQSSGMVLTDLGRLAVRAAEQMDSAARVLDGETRARAEDASGVVRLTTPPWIAERLLIPALPTLRGRHPELELRLLGTHELLDVAKRAADVALRNVLPTEGALLCQRVGELAGCVYGSAPYLQLRGKPISREDLVAHDLLAYEGMGGMPGFEWLRDEPFRDRVVFRAGDPAGLASAIRSGLGLGAIPCLLGEADAALERVEPLGVGFSPLYVVYAEELCDSARIRATVRFLIDVLRANEAMLMGRAR